MTDKNSIKLYYFENRDPNDFTARTTHRASGHDPRSTPSRRFIVERMHRDLFRIPVHTAHTSTGARSSEMLPLPHHKAGK